MEVEKKGLLPTLFKLHPSHNESGSFSPIWIEFAVNFGGCKRVLSQILQNVAQNCSHNSVHQKKRYVCLWGYVTLISWHLKVFLRNQYCNWKAKPLNSELYFRWQIVIRWCYTLCCPWLQGCSRLPWDSRVAGAERDYFHANSMSSCATSERTQVLIL